MPDAFIYDHVRTPRGRGKADGSLHEVTALELATQALTAIKARSNLDPALVDDVILGCVDPVGEAGGDIARAAAINAGYGNSVPGVQINRFCASGLDAVNFAAAQVMSGQHDMTIGGGIEFDEPGRHRRFRRRLAGRSCDRAQVLFHAAGHLGRSDRHQIRLLARAMRRICGAEPAARRQGLGRGPLREFGYPGQGREWADHPGARRAHAARDQHAVAGAAQALVRADGRARWLRCGGGAGASRDRVCRARASRRQFLRHRRWRRRGPDRQPRGRRRREAQAARQDQGLRQYRLGARLDAHRAGRCHREGAQARQDGPSRIST